MTCNWKLYEEENPFDRTHHPRGNAPTPPMAQWNHRGRRCHEYSGSVVHTGLVTVRSDERGQYPHGATAVCSPGPFCPRQDHSGFAQSISPVEVPETSTCRGWALFGIYRLLFRPSSPSPIRELSYQHIALS